jgi:iron(III) transport system permease protein
MLIGHVREAQKFLVGRYGIAVVASVPLLTAAALLVFTMYASLRSPQGDFFTLENFRAVYSNPLVAQILFNTAIFAGFTVLVALAFAIPAAWLVEKTDLPGRGAVYSLMTVGLLVPGFFTAMGWVLMLDPDIGMVNKWIVRTLQLERSPIAITNVVGMGWVEGLALSPLAFIMLAGAFGALDPALEESAQLHGMRLFSRLRHITIPLMWPAILATAIYLVVIGFAAFDTPAIIGLPNRIFTFSTFVRTLTSPDQGPPNYGLTGALSVLMIAVGLLLGLWYVRVVQRSHRYAVIRGRNYRAKQVELGKSWIAGWALIGLQLLFAVVLPVLVLIWGSVTPFLEPPSISALSRASLQHYSGLYWGAFWDAVQHTAFLVITVPTITVVFGIAISWVVTRSNIRGSTWFDILAFLPHAVPSVIFAVGILLIGLFWVPRFLPFYGTVYSLLAVYIVTRISFATRVYNSALIQIHRELDEAGQVFGMNPVRVLRYILGPLLLPVVLYTWIWMALLTYRELTMAAILSTPKNFTLPVYIFTLTQSNFADAAAVSVLLMMGIFPLLIVYFTLSRRWVKSAGV